MVDVIELRRLMDEAWAQGQSTYWDDSRLELLRKEIGYVYGWLENKSVGHCDNMTRHVMVRMAMLAEQAANELERRRVTYRQEQML